MTTATEAPETAQAKIEQAIRMYPQMLALCLFEEPVNDLYPRQLADWRTCIWAKKRCPWESVRRFGRTTTSPAPTTGLCGKS